MAVPRILQAIGMIFWNGGGISGDSIPQLVITSVIVAAKQETDIVVISLQMINNSRKAIKQHAHPMG